VKVLINAVSANMGGALTYITSILREIPHIAGNDKFVVVIPPATQQTLKSVVDKQVIELAPYELGEGKALQRMYFDNWILPRLALEHEAEVLFSATGFCSLRSPCPQVLLVRNAAFFCPLLEQKYKEVGRSYHSVRARRWMSLVSVRGADAVLFPTDAVLKLLETHTSLAGKRTEVLHYGFAPDGFFCDGADAPDIVNKIDRWKNKGYQILLNVSACAFHKNLETIIKSLPAIISSGLKVKFVTTLSRGRLGDPEIFDRLMKQTRELGLSDVVVSAGYLKHDQMHHLYKKADVFIFPSFTESFGHPLVEAMACGLPVVASDMPVNRELCGEAASYFDTFSKKNCSEILTEVLSNRDKRLAMRERSLERAKDFSWQSHVTALLKMFRELCK